MKQSIEEYIEDSYRILKDVRVEKLKADRMKDVDPDRRLSKWGEKATRQAEYDFIFLCILEEEVEKIIEAWEDLTWEE